MTTDRTDAPAALLALRPREAARALSMSEKTLWTLTQEGDIPHVKIGRMVLYPVRALEEWLLAKASADKVAEP